MLKYKALWIDDTPHSAEPKMESIEEFLLEEGFVFEPVLQEDADGISDYLGDPELDIIITDFNGVDVKELISKIQALEKYIDIVLYSENPTNEFYEAARSTSGIYPCTREDVEDTIKKVIQATIRRTQNVTNMRGIVIAEGIDIENQIEEIIVQYFDDKGDLAKKVLEKEGVCDFGKKIAFLNSILKKITKNYNKMISEGIPKIKSRIRKKKTVLQPLYHIAKKLADEVMKPRNVLAHVEMKIGPDNVPYLKSMYKDHENIKANLDWCKGTRKNLQKHSENLANILKFINEN